MYYLLHAYVRSSRSLVAVSFAPTHPLQAIAISECISFFGPLSDAVFLRKAVGYFLSAACAPEFSGYLFGKLASTKKKNEQIELFILVFVLAIKYFNTSYL